MKLLERPAARCRMCGKTVTPEEVEVGISPHCPYCDRAMRNARRGNRGQRG